MKSKENQINERIALSPRSAAAAVNVAEGSLANLRVKRQGPRFFKVGRRVLYLPSDLIAWVTANPVLTKDSQNQG
ncbi:MAG: DNA-binding protein [Deltaproteobacteria bacterium]|nr:DNA-binding protein [Deltaproteobacteria bacterium]